MVQPSFNYYIAPSMVHADIIVPRGGDNEVAIELIVQHVHTQLQLVSYKIFSSFYIPHFTILAILVKFILNHEIMLS